MFKIQKFYPPTFDPQRYWEDKYAREHIAGKHTDEFSKQGFWPLLQKYFVKGKRYLDAGCGIGGWILFLRDEGYTVEGIDSAARTIRALTEYDPGLIVKVASITGMPYPDNSLDGVLAIGTLEYVEDMVPDALREVHRILKDGGVFFFEVPTANLLRRLFYLPLKHLEYIIKKGQGQHPTFSNYLFTPQTIREQLAKASFTIVEMQPHELPDPDSHYGLYIDWLFLRGKEPYKLNALGKIVKAVSNALSPWIASTGMIIVAKKI